MIRELHNMESMTLNEMITRLQRIKSSRGLTGNELVVACSDYGDRSHTLQALTLGNVETCPVMESDYSDSGYKILEEDPEDHPELQMVVCLNFPV